MKKFISFLLSIVFLVTSFGAFTASGAVNISIEYGDVNASGIINGKDAIVLMQYINGWDVDNFYAAVADTVLDDTINNKDYIQLVRYLNGWDVILGSNSKPSEDDLVNNGVNPEDYRGRTIKFISTIDPAVDESGPVVQNFEKEYGITVEIVPSGLDEHAQRVMGLIAAGNSPDVARSNGDFPAFMGYMQSLDAAKLDYNEPIWNQNMFKMTTFGGSPYLCSTVGNIWTAADIVMYSKSLLKQANAYTPEEYDAMGKWTWDAFFEIGKKVQKVTGIPGSAIKSYESFYHAAGGSVYKFKDGKVTSGFDNRTVEIMTKYSQANKDNILIYGFVSSAFIQGSIGIGTLDAWSLKKTGDLKNANWNDLGFYYLPYYDEAAAATGERPATGILRGWGICKGAKEPVAAGIFLREYLDVNNYDVGSTFISPDAERFFFEVTNIDYSNYNPYFTYLDRNYFVTGVKSTSEIYAGMYYDPSQVNAYVAAAKGAVDKGVNNINTFIEQNLNSR